MSMNGHEGVIENTYIRDGIAFMPEENKIRIDLSHPRSIIVHAVDELTGEIKLYMLRVTSKRSLCLS